jgi:MFS family permease
MLLLVYVLNFIDRQIIGILARPIKAELALTDTQLGLLGGLAFALFYATLGIPIALLADRHGRARIIALSLALWSAFTALCGTAGGYWQLFLYRVGVGVGEAGGVAPSYALIAEHFRPEHRARAFAIFSFGVPLGSALGIMLGGWIASRFDWRSAFIMLGIVGLIVAPLFHLTMRRHAPERPGHVAGGAPTLRRVLATLAGKPAFWLVGFGASAASVIGYGLAFWLPSYFGRSLGLSLVDTALFYGTIVLAGGAAGLWGGGWLSDRLGSARRPAYALVPAACFLIAIPFYLAAMTTDGLAVGFLLFLIPQALGLTWMGPLTAAIQGVVPPEMRATASAIFLFLINLIGFGGGAWALGLLSDLLRAAEGEDSLRYAMMIGLAFYGLAAVLLAFAARYLDRDWED